MTAGCREFVLARISDDRFRLAGHMEGTAGPQPWPSSRLWEALAVMERVVLTHPDSMVMTASAVAGRPGLPAFRFSSEDEVDILSEDGWVIRTITPDEYRQMLLDHGAEVTSAPAVRLLAAMWADHHDYRTDWNL